MKQTPKQIKAEEKQMMLAFILIIAVLLSFQFFTPKQDNSLMEDSITTAEETPSATPSIMIETPQSKTEKISDILTNDAKLPVQNDFVVGSLLQNGGVFNNLNL